MVLDVTDEYDMYNKSNLSKSQLHTLLTICISHVVYNIEK